MADAEDYFALLGLPRQYDIDADLLEANYLARSREAHPDFHQGDSESVRIDSLRDSSLLNEAYRTLRDPFQRAEHLLKLLGGLSAAEAKEMPQAFLMATMELRMALEEAKDAGDPESLQTVERNLIETQQSMMGEVAEHFRRVEEPGRLMEIRKTLNMLKFVRGLLKDLRDS